MDEILRDLTFIMRHWLEPVSAAKWVVKKRKMGLAFTLFAIIPIWGSLLSLLFSIDNDNMAGIGIRVWASILVGSVLLALGIAWLISATSGSILGRDIPFDYVFCALSAAQIAAIPLLAVAVLFSNLALGFRSFSVANLGISALAVAPAASAWLSMVTLIFTFFGLDKNRIVRGTIIYILIVALILALVLALSGAIMINNLNSFLSF
ncbi:hypothetical protein BEQ56_09280 [Anaerolineaceae bacterium oral taxon 439]|nr:hypothetical protein BEQ56_09280 [Anaerolineaceae bacterium oral taxon 439]